MQAFLLPMTSNGTLQTTSRPVRLDILAHAIHGLFEGTDRKPDPVFSRWIPVVYDSIGISFKEIFEPEFCHLFNGIMVRGQTSIQKVFLATFPSSYVLRR